jgi:hypothetical protein
LKEQNKYDDMLFGFFQRLRDILPLANTVVEEIGYEDSKVLEKGITDMVEVMQKVAKFSCEYVKRRRSGRSSSLGIRLILMLVIAERMMDAFADVKDKETIKELDQELTKVIEELMRVVDVKALHLARQVGKKVLCLTIHHSQSFSCRAKFVA